MKKITPQEIIKLVKELPDVDHHIFEENGEHYITQEWLCGAFAGRAFCGNTIEDAAQEMIDYLYRHIGHNSMVGKDVTESGFPDLEKVKKYCLSESEMNVESHTDDTK